MAPHDNDRECERRAGRHAAGPRAPRVRLRRLRAAQGYKLGHYPRLSQMARAAGSALARYIRQRTSEHGPNDNRLGSEPLDADGEAWCAANPHSRSAAPDHSAHQVRRALDDRRDYRYRLRHTEANHGCWLRGRPGGR